MHVCLIAARLGLINRRGERLPPTSPIDYAEFYCGGGNELSIVNRGGGEGLAPLPD